MLARLDMDATVTTFKFHEAPLLASANQYIP